MGLLLVCNLVTRRRLRQQCTNLVECQVQVRAVIPRGQETPASQGEGQTRSVTGGVIGALGADQWRQQTAVGQWSVTEWG